MTAFDPCIAQAKEMIARLKQCRDQGFKNVPADVPVSNEEYSTWYESVGQIIDEHFGTQSKQHDKWNEIVTARAGMISRWIRDNYGASTEVPYLNHLQTSVVYLRALDSGLALKDGGGGSKGTAPTLVDRYFSKIRNNPVLSLLIVVGVAVVALAQFTDAVSKLAAIGLPYLESSELPNIPGGSAWVLLGDFDVGGNSYIRGPFYSVFKSAYPDGSVLPRKGELIRLSIERNTVIPGFKVSGLARQLVPPWKLNILKDNDYTGVKLPKGSVVEIRDVSLGSYPNQPAVVWARIAAPPK